RILLCILLLTPAVLGTREPRTDPQSQRIRLKYIGDCLAIQTPTRGMELDPLISLRLVPSSEQEWAVDYQEIKRYMRMYMPRTLEDHLENTDVVMLSNTAANYFRPDWIGWLADGVGEGQGMIMVGGYCSFGGYNYPDWGPNQIGTILPVETIIAGKKDFPFKLSPVDEDNPLLSVFDWERGPHFFALNTVELKQGASVLARSDPEDRLLMVYWDIGDGSVLAFMSTWGLPWGDELVRWEYFVDFSADMVYYSAGIGIPDPVIVHQIRVLFEEFHLAKGLVSSILEFVEMLGGRTTGVRDDFEAIVQRRSEAETHYVEQDYASCQQQMSVLVDEMNSLNEAAIRAKDAAFFWIYLTEWSAVTGTLMFSGYILYAVMFRRRLYREVSSTRTR
ncbi:MAG: hypothetical protein HXS50_01270, partial [Theionarchaea archaeon]|nr:hypothetical protein [Theionarchaea archaeon]